MSKKSVRTILATALLVLAVLPTLAQDGAYSSYSPYSIFGVGDLYNPSPSQSRGMGGVGIASRNKRFVNYMNPAAVTARDTLSFMLDFGASSENKMYMQNGVNSINNTFNINDIVVSFPVFKNTAFMFGITPFSSVGYKYADNMRDPNLVGAVGNIGYTAKGNGSIYQLFAAFGAELWGELSLGAEFIHYFGNIDKSTELSFENSSQRNIDAGHILQLRGNTAKFGAQWDHKIGAETNMTVGATYRLKTDFTGYSTAYKYATLASIRDTLSYKVDTLAKSHSAGIGDELGVGFSIRHADKWIAEVDYTRSNWTGTRLGTAQGFSANGISTFAPAVSQAFRAGFEYTPSRNDLRYFLKTCTYRVGAYFRQDYYKVDGAKVNQIGLTLGMTIPVYKWYNGVTVGVDIGQRGHSTDPLVREPYVLFSIGFNIHDIWFLKMQYN